MKESGVNQGRRKRKHKMSVTNPELLIASGGQLAVVHMGPLQIGSIGPKAHRNSHQEKRKGK